MKPHWEFQHDCWIDEIKFDIQQRDELLEMLKKHPDPDDNVRMSLLSMIKGVKRRLEMLCREYKKIYGVRPDLRRLKNEIHGNS